LSGRSRVVATTEPSGWPKIPANPSSGSATERSADSEAANNHLREENETLRSERNHLLRDRNELHRKLEGARTNISRLNEQRVTLLFPNGPGKSGEPKR